MCDNKRILIVGFGHSAPLVSDAIAAMLSERGVVMPVDPQLRLSEDFDYKAAMTQLDAVIKTLFRESFREEYKDRIDRYQRKWPRRGCTLLPWNRKIKWQPRFFSGPSRRLHFSQSQLRLSQVLSWRQPMPGRLRRDSSRGLQSHL